MNCWKFWENSKTKRTCLLTSSILTIICTSYIALSLPSLAFHREHKAQFLLLSPALIKNLSGIDLWQLFVCFAETFAAARPGPYLAACAGPGCCLQNFNPKLNEILCPRVFLFVVLVAGCGVWPAGSPGRVSREWLMQSLHYDPVACLDLINNNYWLSIAYFYLQLLIV